MTLSLSFIVFVQLLALVVEPFVSSIFAEFKRQDCFCGLSFTHALNSTDYCVFSKGFGYEFIDLNLETVWSHAGQATVKLTNKNGFMQRRLQKSQML